VYSWSYDPAAVSVSSKTTLITNMSNTDHTTRTLLLSRSSPGLLLVSRGSSENMDAVAADVTSGHSQIRVFNISSVPSTPYNYSTDGVMLGWGLRNSVGVAEEPLTGGIYSVENSADQLKREGTDIHENNPGEEMNFHGVLNDTSNKYLGKNYGYPDCFALWDTNVPDKGNMTTGSQFVLDPSSTLNDTTCANERIPPRLTFQAHMAPLDIKFTPDGTLAYVTFHGSWNRDEPAGYKLSVVQFDAGGPVSSPDSQDAAIDILSNADNSVCPDKCFRPAGVALDAKGRVFMTSDATGDIYVLQRAEMTITGGGGGGDGGSASGSLTNTGSLVTSTGGASATPNVAAGMMRARDGKEWAVVVFTGALAVIGGALLVVA
jgi:glucose/arabinose dehydrogenase